MSALAAWATVAVGLVVWAIQDEIRQRHRRGRFGDPRVTVVGESDPWDEYVLGLRPGDVIVGADGMEYEVTEAWPADAIVATLADLDQLPEVAA